MQVTSLLQQSVLLFKNENEFIGRFQDKIKKSIFIFCDAAKKNMRQLAFNLQKEVISHFNFNRLMVNQKRTVCFNGSKNLLASKKQSLSPLKESTFSKPLQFLKTRRMELSNLEKNINNMSPENVLKRGYSITLYKGKAINNFKSVNAGDSLNTIVFDGNIRSIVKSSQKPTNP